MLNEEILRSAAAEVQCFLAESVPEEETAHQFSEDFERKMKKAIRKERMRRWLPTAIYLTAALIIFVCCCFIDSNILWQEPLSEADRQHLNNKLVLQYNETVNWDVPDSLGGAPYYGTINNCVILRTIRWSAWDTERGHIQVAGYHFYWIDPFELYVYRDGEICTLRDAYERGWLTDAHLAKIYERHQESIAMLQEGPQEIIKEYAQWIEEQQGGN